MTTPGAERELAAAGLQPIGVLARHATGDHGRDNNDPDMARPNAAGIDDGGPIRSFYWIEYRQDGRGPYYASIGVTTFAALCPGHCAVPRM